MENKTTPVSPADELITSLDLVPHPEGGYFRESYRTGAPPMKSRGHSVQCDAMVNTSGLACWDAHVSRNIMTSIYWLMVRESNPVLNWCINKSDTVHYWQGGDSILYHLISPDGEYSTQLLGGRPTDLLLRSARPQVIVQGGTWKAAELVGEYCLVGEGVAPGFDFDDFSCGNYDQLQELVGEERAVTLAKFLQENPIRCFDAFYADNENEKSNLV